MKSTFDPEMKLLHKEYMKTKRMKWIKHPIKTFYNFIYYLFLEGGYENNVKRIGRPWFTAREAETYWLHHGKWYTKLILRQIYHK